MANTETAAMGTRRELPVAYAPSPARPSLARSAPEPSFLSQMIAERDRMPSQRLRRRAPLGTALAAYADGEKRDELRLPTGGLRSLTA